MIRHIVKLQNMEDKEKNLIRIRKKEQIFYEGMTFISIARYTIDQETVKKYVQ